MSEEDYIIVQEACIAANPEIKKYRSASYKKAGTGYYSRAIRLTDVLRALKRKDGKLSERAFIEMYTGMIGRWIEGPDELARQPGDVITFLALRLR